MVYVVCYFILTISKGLTITCVTALGLPQPNTYSYTVNGPKRGKSQTQCLVRAMLNLPPGGINFLISIYFTEFAALQRPALNVKEHAASMVDNT